MHPVLLVNFPLIVGPGSFEPSIISQRPLSELKIPSLWRPLGFLKFPPAKGRPGPDTSFLRNAHFADLNSRCNKRLPRRMKRDNLVYDLSRINMPNYYGCPPPCPAWVSEPSVPSGSSVASGRKKRRGGEVRRTHSTVRERFLTYNLINRAVNLVATTVDSTGR